MKRFARELRSEVRTEAPSLAPHVRMSISNDFIFHHIGVACESIAAEGPTWALLGYRLEGMTFVDEVQGIRGQFMTGGGPRIELLEATVGSSTLAQWIKRRVKLYHMGYLVRMLDATSKTLLAGGATVVREPMMSTYFKARISFLMMPDMSVIELIEARQQNPSEMEMNV
jgi:methylmalonyl-CoA/ethylmalonyl-CoA epimerase